MKFNKNKKTKYGKVIKSGFTLMESLIAIAILTVGIFASVGAIASSMKLSTKIENKTVASYLAVEGLELVKNIRDMNWVSGNAFDAGILDGWGCVEHNSNSIDYNCSNSQNSATIKFDGSYYSHSGGQDTIFSRTITVTKISSSEFKVSSSVTCGGTCQVVLNSYFFDWK